MNDAAKPAGTWWAWTARGLLALVFAGVLVARDSDTLAAIAVLLGLHCIADAPMALLIATLGATKTRPWVPMVFVGLVDLALAFVVVIAPGAPAVALLWAAAPVLWAILLGILHLVAASPLRPAVAQRLLGVVGALNVLLAVVLAWFPVPGVVPVALGRPPSRAELVSTAARVVMLLGAVALSLLGGLLVLPVGPILDDRVSWLLLLGMAGVFATLGTVWASTLLARTTAAVQLGRVLVATEVVAVGLWLAPLSPIGGRLARVLETNLAYLAACAVVLAVAACLATGLARGGRRDVGRLGRATLGMVVLVVVAVPAVVVVASWFGLVGA